MFKSHFLRKHKAAIKKMVKIILEEQSKSCNMTWSNHGNFLSWHHGPLRVQSGIERPYLIDVLKHIVYI